MRQAPGGRGGAAGLAAGCFQAYKTHRRRGRTDSGAHGMGEQWTGGCTTGVRREDTAPAGGTAPCAAQRSAPAQRGTARSAGCSVRVVGAYILHRQAGHSPSLGVGLQRRSDGAGGGGSAHQHRALTAGGGRAPKVPQAGREGGAA